MPWARWTDTEGFGTPEIIYSPKGFKDDNGISHPSTAFLVWSLEELAAVGWYKFIPFVVPNGEQVVTNNYTQSGLEIVEGAVTQPLPPPPPPPKNSEIIDAEITNSKALTGIIKMLATDKGVTEQDITDNIKSHVPDV